jgi:hypothetical protein
MNNYLIPVDKANHFIVGTIIYVLSAFILSPLFAMIPVIIIGLSKEIYDYITKKGTPDIIDFLFTVLGALPPLILNFIK